jgi:hypothetical protein
LKVTRARFFAGGAASSKVSDTEETGERLRSRSAILRFVPAGFEVLRMDTGDEDGSILDDGFKEGVAVSAGGCGIVATETMAKGMEGRVNVLNQL